MDGPDAAAGRHSACDEHPPRPRPAGRHDGRRESAQAPGKILHELRRATVALTDITLPPLYYGTVDATPLWVCVLHEAWQAGAPTDQVAALLPTLEGALRWMVDYGDADGDGFCEYIDASGHGLTNQGWKDSADAVRFADGSIATGPVALCEVQGTRTRPRLLERLCWTRSTARAVADYGTGRRT